MSVPPGSSAKKLPTLRYLQEVLPIVERALNDVAFPFSRLQNLQLE
jgi:hypothetical protein